MYTQTLFKYHVFQVKKIRYKYKIKLEEILIKIKIIITIIQNVLFML